MERALVSTTTAPLPSTPSEDDIPVLDISDQPAVSIPEFAEARTTPGRYWERYEENEPYPDLRHEIHGFDEPRSPEVHPEDLYASEPESPQPQYWTTGLRSSPQEPEEHLPQVPRTDAAPLQPENRTQNPGPKPIRRRTAVALERNAIRRERGTGKRSKTYSCRLCDKRLNSQKALFDHKQSRRHRYRANQPSKKALYCAPCDQSFESLDHLGRHQRGKRHLAVVSRC